MQSPKLLSKIFLDIFFFIDLVNNLHEYAWEYRKYFIILAYAKIIALVLAFILT